MILNAPFYNETIKRVTAVFGTLFNDIMIQSKDSASGNLIKRSKVPLSYGPKEKFLQRITTEPDFDENKQQIAITLPRMSFMLSDISYYPEIQTSMFSKQVHYQDATRRSSTRSGVPYQMTFDLTVMTKKQTDAFQIIEQIIPFFRPNFLVTVKQLDDYETVWDLPITLTSIQPDINYEGQQEERRIIIWTLTFTTIARFFEPVVEGNPITKVFCHLRDIDDSGKLSSIIVEATEDGSPKTYDIENSEITTTIIDDFFTFDDDDE